MFNTWAGSGGHTSVQAVDSPLCVRALMAPVVPANHDIVVKTAPAYYNLGHAT